MSDTMDALGRCLSVVREYVGTQSRIIADASRYYPEDIAPVIARIYADRTGCGTVLYHDGHTTHHATYLHAREAASRFYA